LTGKTVGGSFLNENETVWLNADRKPLTFKGANKRYNKESKNYATVTGYDEMKKLIKQVADKGKSPLIVFILAHTETYKGSDGLEKVRLKVLGKMATKLNIEGSLTHTYYTFIDEAKDLMDPARYTLTTSNSGRNTGRSPQGMWDTYLIPNNYQLIVNKILEEYN